MNNARKRSKIVALTRISVKSLRPKQWTKNMLVAAAPVAAGEVKKFLATILLAFIAFTLASSICYLINDWLDQASDRKHEHKRLRPIAAGEVSRKHFIYLIASCSLLLLTLLSALSPALSLLVLLYLASTILYSLVGKSIPVLELLWVASGFLIRALSGSAVIKEEPTGWFLVFIFFGALQIVLGKRLSELRRKHPTGTRLVLKSYTERFLFSALTASSTITVLTYCLWVFEVHSNSVYAYLSIFPLTLTVLLFLFLIDTEQVEAPEELFLFNKFFRHSVLATLIPLLILFYK